MATDENVFNFNVSPFINGIKRIGDGMASMRGMAENVGKSMTKALNSAIMKVGSIVVAIKGFGAALKYMPEVGQAFGIAKDVFMKNLLWPLRQQIMPMLQRMLDWVRDNRARFAQWGATLANVFRTVLTVAKTLYGVFKQLLDVVGSAFQRAFRSNFKNFDEFLNVLSFKVSAVIVYMGMLAKDLIKDFKPAFDWILDVGGSILGFFGNLIKSWTTANDQGKSLWTVFDKMGQTLGIIAGAIGAAVKGFAEGFAPAVKNIMTPIDNVLRVLNQLLKAIGLDDKDGIRGGFSALGSIIGTLATGALATIAAAFDTIVQSLLTLMKLSEIIDSILKGDWSAVSKKWNEIGPMWEEWAKRQGQNFGAVIPSAPASQGIGGIPGVHDAIITKTGKVIRTDPDDNIVATKAMPVRGGGRDVAVTMSNAFYVTVTEGDAKRAGRDIGSGLAIGFRERILASKTAEGL